MIIGYCFSFELKVTSLFEAFIDYLFHFLIVESLKYFYSTFIKERKYCFCLYSSHIFIYYFPFLLILEVRGLNLPIFALIMEKLLCREGSRHIPHFILIC